MNKFKSSLWILGICFLIIISCNYNSNTSEKELELKKKELDLKQKELELKEKELQSKQTQSNSQIKNTPVSNNKSSKEEMSLGDKFIGLWKHRGKLNDIGEINVNFIKISKQNNGKLKFQKGNYSINKDVKDNNSEQDIMWETDVDVYPKLLNDKLEGNYRVWQGSAPDAYYDTKFNIELKTDNILSYKSNSHAGGGGDNILESFEATKISN